VRAIVAARGGYGASRFAHTLDWHAFAERPRWIVGFSDITALHVEAARVGVASIHGPHLTALGRADARTRREFVRAIEEPGAPRTYDGLAAMGAGTHTGRLFGGNLALLQACAAAGRLLVPEGCVLLLEDVTEKPYRIDRMLATLEVGGFLERAGAVVLGDFTQCDPGLDGVTVEEVLAERLGRLGVPVVRGLPVGHELRNDPVVLGGWARVETRGGTGSLTLGGA
jgi:muramoyltetrapeptide carboxypeptidase